MMMIITDVLRAPFSGSPMKSTPGQQSSVLEIGDRIAVSIADVVRATGLGRTSIYTAIKSRKLPVRKFGRRTLVLRGDLEAFIASLPTLSVDDE
jgi:hypothetical protein